MTKELMPPCNIGAEQRVIGAILLKSSSLAMVADTLKPEHFYRNAHSLIYGAMVHLYERRESCDQFSISDYLGREGKLQEAGGEYEIGMLFNRVINADLIEVDAQMVVGEWIRRQLSCASAKIADAAYHSETPEDALQLAEELVYGISKRKNVHDVARAGDIFTEIFDEVIDASTEDGAIVGVPTGLEDIDKMTSGLQPSDLIILAGRPAMGKTSCMMTVARNASMQYGRNVLVFSLEMAKKQLLQRLTAHEARVNLMRLRERRLTEEEKERVINVSGSILDASIWIDDTPAISIATMQSKIRRTLAERDIDLIIVDYLQKVTATRDGKRISSRYEEVSEVARGLKDIARTFNLPVLALAQLSRAVEGRADKIPQMSDLRESGDIEQEADIIMFIHRDDYYAGYDKKTGKSNSTRPGTADIVFSKHRNGPTGEVLLGFEANETRFYNLEAMEG